MSNKISIIVPCYNGAKTLDRCINSILDQTYTNFELIIVDDGSTDTSCKTVKKYALEDERVKLFRKENGGVSSARNFGLDYATGDYIQFVDADDDIEPDMLETMLNLLEEKQADVALCNFTHPCIRCYLGNRVFEMRKQSQMLEFYQNTFATVVPWNKLYRREVITNRFVEGVHFCEDELFFVANMQNIRRIAVTDRVLYHYYVAPADTDPSECSCINKMAKAKDFWKTKETYWYKRTALLPITDRFFSAYLENEELEVFNYTRVFDFMPWEIIILGSMGVDRYGLTMEMQSVFADPRFLKSLDLKRKYGIRYLHYPKEVRNEKIAYFVEKALDACELIRSRGERLNVFTVVMSLFAKEFITEISPNARLNPADFLTKAYLELSLNSTEEAAFVNSYTRAEQAI